MVCGLQGVKGWSEMENFHLQLCAIRSEFQIQKLQSKKKKVFSSVIRISIAWKCETSVGSADVAVHIDVFFLLQLQPIKTAVFLLYIWPVSKAHPLRKQLTVVSNEQGLFFCTPNH